MSELYLYDLNLLWNTDSKVWVIDKLYPKNPIMKINLPDYNSIINGQYMAQNNKISYNGIDGWLSNEQYAEIRRKKPIDLDKVGLSLREYNNVNYITDNKRISFILDDLNEKISIISEFGNDDTYGSLICKLEKELGKNNIELIDKIFINDVEHNKKANSGNNTDKKIIALIEYLVGYKIENDKFVPFVCTEYDIIYYYDNNETNVNMCEDINNYINIYLENSDEIVKRRIKSNIRKKKLITNIVTTNNVNKYIKNEIEINI